MGKGNTSQEIKETTETAEQEEHIAARPKKNTKWKRFISYFKCGCSSAVDKDDSTIIVHTNIPEKNIDTKQDSGAVEETSGKHLFHEGHTERASAVGLRFSWYDNTQNSHNCEAVLIHGSPESEEKKIDKVPTQTQIEHSCKKQKDSVIHQEPPKEYDRRKSKDVPSQKQVEHSFKKQKDSVFNQLPSEEYKGRKSENLPTQKDVEHSCKKQKDSVIHQEPSEEYDGRKSKSVPSQKRTNLGNMKQDVAEIHEARTPESSEVKSENVQNRKEIERKIFVKSKAAEIHEAPIPESNEVKSDKNVPNQKEIEKKNYVNSKASIVLKEPSDEYDRKKCEIVAFDREPKLSNMKRMEIGLGNYQTATHVTRPTRSAAQPLCQVDSVSSTIRHRAENNAEVKARHVDPPIQEMHVLTQIHQLPLTSQHFGQQSFKQESVASQNAKMSYIQQENTLSIHSSKFQEDSSERPQEIFTSVSNCGSLPGIPTMNKELRENKFCLVKAVDDVNKTNDKMPDYESLHDSSTDTIQKRSMENLSCPKLQHVDPPIQRIHVPKQNHQLLLTPQHYVQHSFKQVSVPSPEAKLSDIHPENTLSPNLATFQEDSSERQQEIVTSVNNCRPMLGMPPVNTELTENKFCLVKVVDDVDKGNDKTPNFELLHDASTDTIQKRSMENLSVPKPSVDLSIDQNSDGQSLDADSRVNNKRTPVKLLSTVCDSNAAHGESCTEEENKTTVDDTLTETGENVCTVEQRPEMITSNLETIKVHRPNQDEDGFTVTQTGCETYENNISEIKEVGDKTGTDLLSENSCVMQNSLVIQPDEDYVESVAKPNDIISRAGDENRDLLSDNEANYLKETSCDETRYRKSADFGDMEGVTIDAIFEDKQTDWTEVSYAEICDWENAELGEMAMTMDKIGQVEDEHNDWREVEDEHNDWKEALIEDGKTADFGETDETNGNLFEDTQNELEPATDCKIELSRTDTPNGYESSDIDCRTADGLSTSIVESCLNEVNGGPHSRTESHQEHHPHINLIFARNDEKVEECFEELRNSEHPKAQPLSSSEANTSEESGVPTDKADIDNGRPAEDVPTGNALDLNTAERDSPQGLKSDEDKQDGAFVEGHQREAGGQDIANVQENTETEPANDQEEIQAPSPTASDAQTPHEMVSAAKAVEKGNEITKTKKIKDTSTEITKPRRPMARRPVGLQNLGNTCFFNAVMQNLNQSFLLYEVLAQEGCSLSLTESMVGFYKKMCSGTSYTVNPREVLVDICRRSPRFAGGRQQDSHELLRHLLDGLRTEDRESLGNPNNRKVLTNVDKVFGGHFMTVYTCRDCRTPYHVCEPLLDISLPIAHDDFPTDEESSVNEEDGEVSQADAAGDAVMYQKVAESLMTPLAIEQKKDAKNIRNECVPEVEAQQPSKKQKKKRKKSNVKHPATKKSRTEGRSILDCLDAFTRTEHIADEYLCMACHAVRVNQGASDYQMTSAKKRTLIYNPPALLTLHLKRFEQTPHGFVKCNKSISFQDMIDIGPYCSSWCMRNEGKETSIWYSLYGLVVHGGSLDGGHYVAYVKLRETEANIRQFLQESYLDRDQLTVEILIDMMKEMHELPKPNQSEKRQPKPVKGTWFYISDSHFDEVPEDEVWQQQAYLLFYERRQGNNRSNRSVCVTVYPAETCV